MQLRLAIRPERSDQIQQLPPVNRSGRQKLFVSAENRSNTWRRKSSSLASKAGDMSPRAISRPPTTVTSGVSAETPANARAC